MERTTNEQRDLLFKIIKTHKKVLENKKSDNNSSEEKRKCWKKVTEQYNAQNVGKNKTEKQLKSCWVNMKIKYKKENAKKKRDLMATGGGPPTVGHVDYDPEFEEMMAPAITPHKNPFDDNADMEQENVNFLH